MDEFEIAETEYGLVKGIHKLSALNEDYISFQGIPYMKAPLGNLRFRDAQPPEKWSHTFDAAEEIPSYCGYNLITNEYEGQENAGIINIFTKNLKADKLPVMIWIHGGAFQRGSSKTDLFSPDYLLQKEIVFLSFNFRLGAIGFLSLEDESLGVPGNTGLKDQLFALKWIKRNIKNFGGDPDNVTVFGDSAGAGAIHLLSLCEQSKGLFKRAILMSGTAFCKRWSLIPRTYCRKFAHSLAVKLGWKGRIGDEKSLLQYLENVQAIDIVQETATLLTNEDEFADGIVIPFAPVIEPYKSDNCLIYKDPVEMAREAWSNDIEMIFTGTSFEGIIQAFKKEEVAYFYLQENPSYFTPLTELDLQVTDPIAGEYGERIKELYFKGNQKPSMENQESYLRFSSENMFWHGIYRAVLSRMEFANSKTFLMRFNVDAKLNFFKILKKCEKYHGACHVDDVFYIFKTNFTEVPPIDSKEFKVIEKMVGIFTSFACNGDPNCLEIKPGKFTSLRNGNADEIKCTEITENDVTEILLPELSKLKVWNSIFSDHDVPLY